MLEIRDLAVSFATEGGTVRAVNGISYALKEGEVLGVVGESGSGKSVHALAVMQLLSPPAARVEAGEIRFRGTDLLRLDDRAMRAVRGRQIGMIFQDPISSLNPVYTVGFQLCEVLRLHLGLSRRDAATRAAELLSLVGIPDARQRLASYPHELSGGMRQRVMIALAIACNPSLVIADEPTTALDVTIQAQIVALIKRLQRDMNLTVIWISHDLGVIAGLAQTVNVMYAGHIVERGPVRSIYKDPRHPYTVGLLGSLPRLDETVGGRLRSIPGRPPDMTQLPAGCPFAARCPQASERCGAGMPPVEDVGDGHSVRCWHWRDVVAARAA
ncbi:ABC transporter ATP-binding protein [Vineibacter terrae]|uniref:ABC transporter ATP-binding protein n=1 Tax=Vineibacter terrae TaxID=2586908 RepID=UPI002E34548E|nr:ABC transporter ATP-binding protein [Vineibacter terrae]HEX2889267.1 ABC transporter ATP-binding protein [Vineibacter terrae]